MGMITMVMSFCTVISSLNSDRMTKRFSVRLVTLFSVVLSAVSLIGSHTANLAFHPSAFAFVSRPRSAPAGVESYVTSFDGISLRVVRGYDMKYKREMLSMDVLYAYKTIYPELAVRCLG